MRWSIEELIVGLRGMSNRGYNIWHRIIRFPRYLFRLVRYTIEWLFTGYFPNTWWWTDTFILEVIKQRVLKYKKTFKTNGCGYSPLVIDEVLDKNTSLDESTEQLVIKRYEDIMDRIVYLIDILLDRVELPEEYENNYNMVHSELFKMLDDYSHILND